jgi:hypothetical protein
MDHSARDILQPEIHPPVIIDSSEITTVWHAATAAGRDLGGRRHPAPVMSWITKHTCDQ